VSEIGEIPFQHRGSRDVLLSVTCREWIEVKGEHGSLHSTHGGKYNELHSGWLKDYGIEIIIKKTLA